MSKSMRRRLIAAVRLGGYRWCFRTGDVTSPRRAARDAVRLWLTPPPPRSRELPVPPGGTETTVETDHGGSVRTLAWGAGPPIFFMHGWGGTGLQVQPLVDPLVRRGFRVVTFDAPGHGRNRRRHTHAGEFGATMAAAVGHHGQPHGVIAHSLGAVAVTRAAVDHQLHIGRLVLLAPLVDASAVLNRFAQLLHVGSRTRPLLAGELRDQTGLSLGAFGCRELTTLVDGCSTLIVHDPSDAHASFADSAALAKSWKGATFMPVNSLGHHRLLRDPEVISGAVDTLTHASYANATACC